MDSTLVGGIQDSLDSIIPSGTDGYIYDYDLQSISFDSVCSSILTAIKDSITMPIDLMLSLVVCILLTALMQSFSEVAKAQRVYSLVSVLVCIRIVIEPIIDLTNSLREVMTTCAMFINSYVPILSSIMVANGQVSSSASYGAITYLSCQVWVQFADSIILPLMSITLAVSCISGICTEVSLGGIVKLIKRSVNWGMSVSMFIFSGVVAVQGSVCNSSDKVTAKALKFVVSNGVPIVGSAISDACETVRSSLGLLKASVGLVGIVVLLVNVLPPIVNIGIMRIVLTLAETLSDMFDIKCIKSLLADVSAVLSTMFSCGICFAITFIVSIGAIMLLVSY